MAVPQRTRERATVRPSRLLPGQWMWTAIDGFGFAASESLAWFDATVYLRTWDRRSS